MKIKGNIVTITKLALLGTASLFAFGSAAYAQDQAADAPVETAETTTDAASELEFLKAQVESLQAQINEIQKKSTATEATWKPAQWATETKVSGRMYFNFSNINQKNNGVANTNTDNTTNFELKRFYLGVDHQFNKIFSGNITTDVTWQSGVGASLYIKKAYLQAKFSDALAIRVGAYDTPWVPFVENINGYRHIEKVLIDRTNFGTSSDWGIHVGGSFGQDKLVEYAVAVLNGGGYRNPPGVGGTNRTHSLDVEGRINVNYAGFTAAIGGYTGKLAAEKGAVSSTPNRAERLDALLVYKNKLFTAGGEYFYAKNWNNVTGSLSATADQKSDGFSLFGSVNFMPQWSAFGRYEWVKPNKLTTPDIKEDFFFAGVQYSPVKIVDLALVYKRDVANDGAISTGNGTIGVAGAGSRGTYDEVGLFGQFRF